MLPFALLAQYDKGSLDLERIFASSDFYPQNVSDMQMYPEEGYYTTSDFDSKKKSSLILKHSFENKDFKDTFFNSTQAGFESGYSLEEYNISKSCKLILLSTKSNHIYRHSSESEYCVFDRTNHKKHIIFEGKKVFYATISPDEKNVGFVYGNNLYIQNLESDKVTQITKDGEMNRIINGKSDWVYEEEFVVVQAFSWSPKGDRIAYYKFDESKVKEVTLPKYDSLYPTQYKYKYPKAGEDNSVVSIWLYTLSTNSSKNLELNEQNDQYIPRIKWTSDNNILSIQRMNRLQNHLELLLADATTGNLSKLYDEQNNTYIDITDNLHFLKDNSFIITSEKEGYNQIYLYGKDGKLIRKLTPNPFDVAEICGVDEKNGILYYKASEPSPLVKYIYSIKLNGGKSKLLLDDQKGQNSVRFSEGYSYFILTNNTPTIPTNVSIYSIKGKKIRTLLDNENLKKKIADFEFTPREFFKIPINKTEYLNASMIKPQNFQKDKKYPVMVSLYGGPGSQQVNEGWDRLEMWYRHLASKGIIVVVIDNRGTGARGEAFKKCTYRKLGQIERDDQITAAKWLGRQSYIDSTRIGIYGWSFGGYMSSMCITKGADAFKLAVAVAPVTDWRYYDNIYTERYMQRPIDNQANYDAGSVLTYTNNLKGKFLLIHGSFDDNVHPQNSFMLINEMIKGNKKYDSEFYPNKSHGISGGLTRLHLYERITDFIINNL